MRQVILCLALALAALSGAVGCKSTDPPVADRR